MPKLPGSPHGTLTQPEVIERLGRSRQCLSKAGVLDFLNYWPIGQGRLYDAYDVNAFRYWLFVRDGLIALGIAGASDPLLPPGETMEAKRRYFDGWVVNDNYGAICPKCEGDAVTNDHEDLVWCPNCGICKATRLSVHNI